MNKEEKVEYLYNVAIDVNKDKYENKLEHEIKDFYINDRSFNNASTTFYKKNLREK